ncbi:bifunctional (p)ppGpp synthetase/guanosine-3',5'-bis(diphosphate) 3'-pyrophosphohydrolase [Erysipelotrichaceae bacterium OttesenSCG-928-M19]|nr:bifunctional (p)ppGpp synthetase/guanosine-3',5'-bis(diphosphate) 3'-pyrophosphohydrolase [Erysipelotrichaceae bacterium OttesenSCG-928-M19]
MNETISSDTVIPFETLIKYTTTYLNRKEHLDLIKKAYDFAVEKHAPQKRKSGEPYVNHVINVAITLAKLQVSPNVIVSGLLHDVVEDCDVSVQDLEDKFNLEVATIVEAVTKLGNLPKITDEEYQAENHRKIFIAMSKDIRVILVKLADRLHNMLTLQYMPEKKQRKIAEETLDVYAPIAHRLGLGEMKATLEDKCLYYLDQKKYFELVELVNLKKKERDSILNDMIKEIDSLLISNNIIVNISGRSKHLYSIYKKMVYKHKKFDEIYDLQAIRIICNDVMTCYGVLGIIHNMYRPIPGRFKDYIAMKKPNMYQSLHTTIIGNGGMIFELQIRTKEMDDIAERGFAAHWRYKEGSEKISQKAIEEQLHWFRDFVSLSDDSNDVQAQEYMHNLQRDIFEANVYALTPKGKVINLPKESSVIDFAYKIHSKVAESMTGALVNGNFVPFNTKLTTGDVVEIQTQNNAPGPSEGWLDIVKTSNARQRIKQYLKNKVESERKEFVEKGRTILLRGIKERELDEKVLNQQEALERCIKFYKVSNFEDVLYNLASKKADVDEIIDSVYNIKPVFSIPKLLKKQTTNIKTIDQGIIVEGIDSIAVELANCCNPIPGDEIIGYVSSGKAIKIHRHDCPNVKGLNSNAFINVYWDPIALKGSYYFVDMVIKSYDRMYLLSDIITSLSQGNAQVMNVNTTINDIVAEISLQIRVSDGEHLQRVVNNIKKIDGVIDVIRVNK